MKKNIKFFVVLVAVFSVSTFLMATTLSTVSAKGGSEIGNANTSYTLVPNSAEYQGASWSNLVQITRNITLEKAYEIANNDPNISYFFFTKGGRMILQTPAGVKVFGYGDVAFFSGKPWWGSAPDLADGYVKSTGR